ncbi:uncharacterized protein [Penaeus vannamei]|uniref:uncharacterized protein n=1 Tax=Penaeus vannamei TaxID=6689 RepID=UPI00387F4631
MPVSRHIDCLILRPDLTPLRFVSPVLTCPVSPVFLVSFVGHSPNKKKCSSPAGMVQTTSQGHNNLADGAVKTAQLDSSMAENSKQKSRPVFITSIAKTDNDRCKTPATPQNREHKERPRRRVLRLSRCYADGLKVEIPVPWNHDFQNPNRNNRRIQYFAMAAAMTVCEGSISDSLDANQPREQAGFRSGFSTTDRIHTHTQIREKINEYRKPLCMAFIDYEKAFDSVQIATVLDYIVLFSESANEMQQLINDLNRESLEVGLTMNKKKTKVMFNIMTYGSETWTTTKLLERKLICAQRGMKRSILGISLRDRMRATWIREQRKVEDILGCIKNKKWQWAGYMSETRRQMDKENYIVLFSESANEMQQLINDLNRESLEVGLTMNKKKTKVMFNIMTYGSETWTTTKLLERKLICAQRGMKRSILEISLRDRMRATWIREQRKVEDILGCIKNKKCQWNNFVVAVVSVLPGNLADPHSVPKEW